MMECKKKSSVSAEMNILGRPICPDCCLSMEEHDRHESNDILFVWYRCRDVFCEGCRLKQYPLEPDRELREVS